MEQGSENFKNYLIHFIKGVALGSANVIPGVSGGTIALITGIFERLINGLKSFDLTALGLLLKGDFRKFIRYTDLMFFISLGTGILTAVLTLARVFEFLFTQYPVYIWSFFFGLILASVFFVATEIKEWTFSVIVFLVIGLVVALMFTLMKPAQENAHFLYLFCCGIVGICSMILPGLSGSFMLVLMGNYQLIMIDSVNNFRFDILFPVAIGAIIGLIAFAHFLSWLLKRWYSQTLAALTGFIAGSLLILYPWKVTCHLMDSSGEFILKNGGKIVTGYQFHLPNFVILETWLAFGIIFIGMFTIIVLEKTASGGNTKNQLKK